MYRSTWTLLIIGLILTLGGALDSWGRSPPSDRLALDVLVIIIGILILISAPIEEAFRHDRAVHWYFEEGGWMWED